MSLSREELAQMTSTTLFTVSRLFSAWEIRGLVKPRTEPVTISDVQALRAIARETGEGPAPIDGRRSRHAPF